MSGIVNQIGSKSKIISGNVGIGTSDPLVQLTSLAPGEGNPANSGTTQTNGAARFYYGGGGLDIGNFSSGDVWMQGIQPADLSATRNITLNWVGGRVGIGMPINSSSIAAGLHVREAETSNAGIRIFKYTSTTGSSQIFMQFTRNDTGGNEAAHGQIVGSGTNSAAFSAWSDERIKERIIDVPSQLAIINQLKVREFNFIGETEREIGFIAQEFEKVLPDAIGEANDEIKTKYIVGWSTADARMVSAIQELSAKNDALEAENTAMKSRMDALEARLTALEGE